MPETTRQITRNLMFKEMITLAESVETWSREESPKGSPEYSCLYTGQNGSITIELKLSSNQGDNRYRIIAKDVGSSRLLGEREAFQPAYVPGSRLPPDTLTIMPLLQLMGYVRTKWEQQESVKS
jgi:hypothetical protein